MFSMSIKCRYSSSFFFF